MPSASAQLDGRIDFFGTFAQLAAGYPAGAGTPAGTRSWCSDLGEMFWNGSRWVTGDPQAIVQGSLPLMILPTGSAVSATGAVTLSTTIPMTTGAGYFYVPANYLATVSAAGWYYGTVTDGTHVTLFNNTFSGTGQPTIPAAPVAFSGLSGATPTGSTGAQIALTVNVPANCLGPTGEVSVEALFSFNSSASAKTMTIKFGTLTGPAPAPTTTTSLGLKATMRNSGATNVQVVTSNVGGDYYAAATQAIARGAIDTTAVLPVTITLNNVLAADFITLESYSIKVLSF